jgi:hypothetical protein
VVVRRHPGRIPRRVSDFSGSADHLGLTADRERRQRCEHDRVARLRVHVRRHGSSAVGDGQRSDAPFRVPGGIITSATVGSVTISESPGKLFASNAFGSSSAPYSGLSTDYKAILGSGAYADLPASITVTLGGLTSGQDYLVQWWTNNASNAAILGAGFTNTTATAINSVTLDANTTNAVGGLGQFAIGTFTASGTSQTFLLSETSGGFNPLINALQVRAVPEPSMTVLVGTAAVSVLLAWRRRSRRTVEN